MCHGDETSTEVANSWWVPVHHPLSKDVKHSQAKDLGWDLLTSVNLIRVWTGFHQSKEHDPNTFGKLVCMLTFWSKEIIQPPVNPDPLASDQEGTRWQADVCVLQRITVPDCIPKACQVCWRCQLPMPPTNCTGHARNNHA